MKDRRINDATLRLIRAMARHLHIDPVALANVAVNTKTGERFAPTEEDIRELRAMTFAAIFK